MAEPDCHQYMQGHEPNRMVPACGPEYNPGYASGTRETGGTGGPGADNGNNEASRKDAGSSPAVLAAGTDLQ